MRTLNGLAVSGGIVMGPLHMLTFGAVIPMQTVADVPAELARVDAAIETAKLQLGDLYEKTVATADEETAAIFDIHAMMLEDEDYLDAIHTMIDSQHLCAPYCVQQAGEQFANVFAAMDDPYMRERAADVRDLSGRIIDILLGRAGDPLELIHHPVVVGAVDLMPSQTVQMDKGKVMAFLSQKGSSNSHASILARSLGIPSVAALGDDYADMKNGEFVIVDGDAGVVVVDPDEATLSAYRVKIEARHVEQTRLQSLMGQPAVTTDGAHIELCANIGHPDEAPGALAFDADGVGLFRSEFLYLDSKDFPTEEVQFQAYKKTLEVMAPRRVVIRTLDLGADKQAPYFDIPDEENPALGYRAIRICLAEHAIFIPQLRALLRASVYGKLAVMFPMITSVREVREVWAVIDKVKADLDAEGIAYAKDIEFGIMIETPAAAMVADLLAREVDFFSVGTNDLTQYTFAADRMNAKISHIFDSGSISILRLIQRAAEAAHQNGIWIGICGESAADPALAPYYIAMGIDELSMSAPAILRLKEQIRQLCRADCMVKCEAFLRGEE